MICKVAKSTVADDSKVPALQLLLNVMERPEVQEQLVSSGGIPSFVKLLKSPDTFLMQLSATVSCCLIACFRSQQHASVSQGRICSGSVCVVGDVVCVCVILAMLQLLVSFCILSSMCCRCLSVCISLCFCFDAARPFAMADSEATKENEPEIYRFSK